MEIDIRNYEDEISGIVVSDNLKLNYNSVFGVDLDNHNSDVIKIKSKEDAENLIKALQKAIELNWWKE